MYRGDIPGGGTKHDELSTGSIIGIINACLVTVLLVVILAIVAVVVFYLRKEQKKRAKSEFTNLNLLNWYEFI